MLPLKWLWLYVMRFGEQEIKRCIEGIEVLSASNCCINEHNPLNICQSQSQILGYYKLNVDAIGPSEQGLADVIRDAYGLVAAASCWCLPILPCCGSDGYVEMFGPTLVNV